MQSSMEHSENENYVCTNGDIVLVERADQENFGLEDVHSSKNASDEDTEECSNGENDEESENFEETTDNAFATKEENQKEELDEDVLLIFIEKLNPAREYLMSLLDDKHANAWLLVCIVLSYHFMVSYILLLCVCTMIACGIHA